MSRRENSQQLSDDAGYDMYLFPFFLSTHFVFIRISCSLSTTYLGILDFNLYLSSFNHSPLDNGALHHSLTEKDCRSSKSLELGIGCYH